MLHACRLAAGDLVPESPISTAFIAELPKTDLHVHLDGSMRLETLIELGLLLREPDGTLKQVLTHGFLIDVDGRSTFPARVVGGARRCRRTVRCRGARETVR